MRHSLNHGRWAGILAIVLVVSFATLVPGGPIETRSFAALPGTVFWGFNAIIIAISLTALASGLGLLRGRLSAARPLIAAGWGYVFILLLDLGHVFPISPDPIPLALGMVEILDFILVCYVIALSHKALGHI